jgi:hypothetical protein
MELTTTRTAAAAPAALAHSPESLRRRQRDRLSPRRGFANTSRPAPIVRSVDAPPEPAKLALAPAPRPKAAVNRLESAWRRPLQDGLRKESSVKRRAPGDVEDPKGDPPLDGGPAGREARHFTVSNVGNNGRIYLR